MEKSEKSSLMEALLGDGSEILTKNQRGLLTGIMMREEMIARMSIDRIVELGESLDVATPTGAPLIFAAAEQAFHEARGTASESPDTTIAKPDPNGPCFRILRAILKAGCDSGVTFRNSATGSILSPVSLFAEAGMSEVVNLFLECKYDPMAGARKHRTASFKWPLELAVSNGHSDMVSTILLSCPHVEIGIDSRLLCAAAGGGHDDILRMLLGSPGAKAVVDAPHPDPAKHTTPLMAACAAGSATCTRLLLAAGADPCLELPLPAGAAGDSHARGVPRTPMQAALALGGASDGLLPLLVTAGAPAPDAEAVEEARRLAAQRASAASASTEARRGPSPQAPSLSECANCGAASAPGGKPLLRCGACKGEVYCSRECQAHAWRAVHRDRCGKVTV